MRVVFDPNLIESASIAQRNSMHGVMRVTEQLISYLHHSDLCSFSYAATFNRDDESDYTIEEGLKFHDSWPNAPVISPFDARALDETDIVFFSSPICGFSDPVVQHANAQAIVLVHDILPLVSRYSNFSSKDISSYMRIIQSYHQHAYFLVVSEHTKKDLLSLLHIEPERVQVMPLAVDHKVFHPVKNKHELDAIREKYQIPSAPFFLFVGRIELRKNFSLLLEALFRVLFLDKDKEVYLVAAGGGIAASDLGSKVEAHSGKVVRDHVIFTGYIDDADLALLYSASTALLFPSFYEGFGLPLLEAMACHTPIICSNVSSLPEVAGDAAIVLPPDAPDLWAEHMQALIESPQLRESYIAKGIKRLKLYSWEQTYELMFQHFLTAINKGSA